MRSRHRLLAGMLAGGIAGSLLVAAGAMAVIRAALRERTVGRIDAETAFLAQRVSEGAADADPQAFAEQAARAIRARVSLIAPDGRVLGDSGVDRGSLAGLESHAARPEIAAARISGTGHDVRRSATTNLPYYYSARWVEGGGPIEVVRLALPASEIEGVAVHYAWLVVACVAVTAILLVVVGYLTVRRLSRPLERMAESVERAAGGELDLPIPAHTTAELARLAAAVRRMQASMVQKIGELDAERAVLSSVIGGMREGLLLVDDARRVRLANAALRRILDLDFDPRGHAVEEVVRHPAVLREVERALAGAAETPAVTVQLAGSDRSFELHVTPVEGGREERRRGVLLLFFDVTRLETLERVRRDFVANVSHELRTPLTSIKAFVENLLDGRLDDAAESRRFLEIVRRHADRMGALIEDLTDLSLIETGSVQLELRVVDAAEVAREVAEQLRPLGEARRVELALELPTPFPVVADRRRLEQILTNLVENAIKFNRDGGSVSIRGATTADGPTIAVADTGIGIPSESVEKVFQRFYQVSRDRSRAVGGTGLGLSIVKHLMRLHGGRVRAESELGRGSTFTLEFPDRRPPGALRATG